MAYYGDSLRAGLKRFFNSEQFTDVTVRCSDGQELKAHKIVLCCQSPVLAAACNGHFLEASSGVIDLEDDDAEAVRAMVHYLYHSDYKHEDHKGPAGPLVLHAHVYAIADKYDIPALQTLAEDHFEDNALMAWDTNTAAFAHAISVVYSTRRFEYGRLRDIVVHISKKHLDHLLMKVEFEEVLSTHVKFAVDLVKRFSSPPKKKSLHYFFDSAQYSDLKIRCSDGHEIKVHRVVLSSQSPVFAAACHGPFREASSGVIDLDDDIPYAVHAMLHWFYHFDYNYDSKGRETSTSTHVQATAPDDKGKLQLDQHIDKKQKVDQQAGNAQVESDVSPLVFHVCTYAIADKYDLPALKDLARSKFAAVAVNAWNSASFTPAIRSIYATTPSTDRGLRDVVTSIAQAHITALLQDRSDFAAVLKEIAEIAADLVALMAKGYQPVERFQFTVRCGNGRCEAHYRAWNDQGASKCKCRNPMFLVSEG
ncbi:hypothetical protein B0A49_03345 [Cryomyces minteri]|uniref:BTB domain-containing protein n=1 Tax=Cryomyces minteri TaxID=331657 RepID=A0A4U0XSG2_9PEZI|nr:hypothetical protein B0A49_03345 [Cryomyces minteri]